MPKELHDQLQRQAVAKGLSGKRLAAYVYGTLRKIEQKEKKQHKSRK